MADQNRGAAPEFTKYHALGNDYLVVDPRALGLTPSGETARLLCDRHFGVGADGVLFGPMAPVEAGRPIELTIFNSDGSACEKSANGIRLFALHLAEGGLLPAELLPQGQDSGGEFAVRTLAGDSPVRIRELAADLASGTVQIGLGRPSFDPAVIGLTGHEGPAVGYPLEVGGRTLTVTSLHNGNPHTVVFPTAEPTRELAHQLGESIAGHPRIPARTNVQFVRVVDGRTLRIEIWERGAGYTLASGASAAAAVAAAHALGLVEDRVTVRMPGGELELTVAPDGALSLTGAVEQVSAGGFSPLFRHRLGISATADRSGSEVSA
ncbi:diaminopimelate epimerase [Streptacidiphilus monticola]|uniref:Diaminopimelate epimerase n=1 Tax=Streptacidiphilus monticola TaxID=2161674 RepID=A0ABW1G4F4_9ACTN